MIVVNIFDIGEGYCDVKPFNTKPNFCSLKSGLWGIMDQKTGNVIIEPQFLYEPLYLFDNKMLACKSDNKKYGIISFDGKDYLSFEYDSIQKVIDNNDIYLVCKKEKWGVFNDKLEITIPFVYDNIEKASCNSSERNKTTLFILKQGKNYEVRTANNELLVQSGVYDNFSNEITDEEILVYKYDEKSNKSLMGVYNYINQKEIIMPKYEELELLDTNYYLVYNHENEAFNIMNDKEEFVDTDDYYFIYVTKNDSIKNHCEYKYRGMNVNDDFCYVYFNILDDNTIESITEDISTSIDDYNYEYNTLKPIDEKICDIIEENDKVDYDYAYLFKSNTIENYINEINHSLNIDIWYYLEKAKLNCWNIENIISLFYNEKSKIRFIEYLIGEHPTSQEEILRQAYVACRMPIRVEMPSRENKFNLTCKEECELNSIYEDEITTIDEFFKDMSDCNFYEDIEGMGSRLSRMIKNAEYVERKKELATIKNKLIPEIEAGKGKSIYIHLSNDVIKEYNLTAYNLNRIVGQKCKLTMNDNNVVIGYAGNEFLDDEAEDCVYLYRAYKREKGFYSMQRYKIKEMVRIDARLDFDGDINFDF